MKWIQHYTDSHTNAKMRQVLRKHGLEGYAFCWICRELVAKEGEKHRLKAEKDWKNTLKEVTKLDDNRIDELLMFQAEVGAICRKSLEIGDLYIPKIREYSDEYTKKLRRNSGDCPVTIDKNRLDKIILHYIKEKEWEESIKNNPTLEGDIFKRNVRPAKQLILMAKNDDLVIQAISAMKQDYRTKNLSWTLETVVKHYPEFVNKSGKPKIKYA